MEQLLLPIVIPGAAGIFALLLPNRFRGFRLVLGFLGTLAAFVAGAALLDTRGSASWGGFELGPIQLDLALKQDGFSSWAVAFAGLMSFLVVLYSIGWFRGRGGAPGRYYGLILLATAGTVGVLMSAHLLLLVLFWEIVTLMLFLLVATGRAEGASGAGKAFVLLGLADMALLLGVVLLATANADLENPLSTATLTANPLGTGSGLHALIFVLLFAAAIAKAGAMPLHTWIPTMATKTHASVMAFLPASLDKVLGIYLLARLSLDWCEPTSGLRMMIMVVGVVTILGAVFMAMIQHDLRRLLSFHAVSQVGYMLLGIGTGTIIGVMGGVFHMLNHAIYKSCLFLGAGAVEREAGTMELGKLGGLAKTMPLTFGSMLVAALAIAGIPPFNGFASKWLVYQACVVGGHPIFLIAALFGSVLTLASFVKVLHSVFWGARPGRLDGVREGGIALRIPMVTLAVFCIVLGVFAQFPLQNWMGPVVGLEPDAAVTGAASLENAPETQPMVTGEPASGVAAMEGLDPASFAPSVLTGLVILAFLTALFIAFCGNMRNRRVREVFIGGETFDRELHTFSGTEFYKTVSDLPAVGSALESGEKGRMDLYEIGGRIGAPIIAGLRRLHTGMLTDYLFWCVIGFALLAAVLLWS